MKPTVPRACFNAVDRKINPIASNHVSSLVHLILPFQFHAWTKHPDQRSRSAQGAFQKMTSLHFYFSFPSYSCFLCCFDNVKTFTWMPEDFSSCWTKNFLDCSRRVNLFELFHSIPTECCCFCKQPGGNVTNSFRLLLVDFHRCPQHMNVHLNVRSDLSLRCWCCNFISVSAGAVVRGPLTPPNDRAQLLPVLKHVLDSLIQAPLH